jgi:hypothetical protein
VDKTTYQSTASVTCDTGFDRSVESISCQQDGKWEYVSCDIKGIELDLMFLICLQFV